MQNERQKFYKDEFKTFKNSNSLEKNSLLLNFVTFIDETEIILLGGRREFGDPFTKQNHPIILTRHSCLTALIIRPNH